MRKGQVLHILELLPQPEEVRYEIKIALPVTRVAEIEAWLGIRGMLTAYPPRLINNAYFDTQRFDALYSADAGIGDRAKARIRWYGDTRQPVKAQLEAKCKRGRGGYKVVDALVGPLDFDSWTWRQLLAVVRPQLSPPMRLLLATASKATACNRYYRRYYASRDGKVRATLDAQLALYPQHEMRPQWRKKAIMAPLVVFEIKAAVQDHDRVGRLMRDVPGRPSRLSKYGMALDPGRT